MCYDKNTFETKFHKYENVLKKINEETFSLFKAALKGGRK